MRIFRGLLAVALTMLGLWCLLWLTVFVLLGFVTSSENPIVDYILLWAWIPASLSAAYLIQPWWPYFWRQRREGF